MTHRRRWRALKTTMLERAGYRCASCGAARRFELDHIKPIWKGGAEWDPGNLQVLCIGCHAIKSRRERGVEMSKDVLDWLAWESL